MSNPTITAVSPVMGHTGGKTLVKITGTNFALPSAPTPGVIPAPIPPPSVAVSFGGVAATEVQVIDATTLLCLTPICELVNGDGVNIPGSVAVTVSNIDALGDTIAGETATLAAAFEYVRPDLSAKSFPGYVVETMLRQLMLQIVSSVAFAVHSDASDPDSIDFDRIPKAPCLVLTDLDFVGSTRVKQGAQEISIGNGKFVTRRAPAGLDIEFTLIGIVTDSTHELVTLLTGTHLFFQKNPRLKVCRSTTGDPAAGYIEFDLEVAPIQGMRVTAGSSASNIRTFAKVVAIRGIPVEDIPGAPNDSNNEVPTTIGAESIMGQGFVVEEVETTPLRIAGPTTE